MIMMVTRNCCTSGNCSKCVRVPGHIYGQPTRCCQFITKNRTMAEKVCRNCHEYKSDIVEANEQQIALLTEESANWVKERLNKPETINNRVF